MADTLEARVARLETEISELKELVDQLSLWVTGERASTDRQR